MKNFTTQHVVLKLALAPNPIKRNGTFPGLTVPVFLFLNKTSLRLCFLVRKGNPYLAGREAALRKDINSVLTAPVKAVVKKTTRIVV
jgi:hypothetical protein